MSLLKIISALLLGSVALRAQPTFSGLLTMGPRALFAVADGNGGAARWLALGQEVEGYTLISYETVEQVLIVEKDGRRVALRLPAAKTAKASPDAGELLTVVRREIQSRDGWTAGVHLQDPQPYGDDYRVLARREDTGEARLIVLTRQGAIKDYWKA